MSTEVPDEKPEVAMEQAMGNLLRHGVLLAAVVLLLGGILYLGRHGTERADRHTFQGEPACLREPSGIISEALAFRGRGMIQLGLLLLIATPVARVLFAAWFFGRQQNYLYLGLTFSVLVLLLYSLFAASV